MLHCTYNPLPKRFLSFSDHKKFQVSTEIYLKCQVIIAYPHDSQELQMNKFAHNVCCQESFIPEEEQVKS